MQPMRTAPTADGPVMCGDCGKLATASFRDDLNVRVVICQGCGAYWLDAITKPKKGAK